MPAALFGDKHQQGLAADPESCPPKPSGPRWLRQLHRRLLARRQARQARETLRRSSIGRSTSSGGPLQRSSATVAYAACAKVWSGSSHMTLLGSRASRRPRAWAQRPLSSSSLGRVASGICGHATLVVFRGPIYYPTLTRSLKRNKTIYNNNSS